MRQLTATEVHATSVEELGLDPTALDLTSIEALAGDHEARLDAVRGPGVRARHLELCGGGLHVMRADHPRYTPETVRVACGCLHVVARGRRAEAFGKIGFALVKPLQQAAIEPGATLD